MPDTDAITGGEELTLDEAAKAYAATQSEEPKGQPDDSETEVGAEADEAETPEGEEADDGNTDDEEGQAEDEADAEPDTEKGRYVAHNGRVKLPDGSESTVADLVQGNLRDRDYRQKTMELAESRKAHEAQSEAIKQREQQYQQNAKHLADLLGSIIPPEPDISMLQTDPLGYMQQKDSRARWIQHLQYLDQQQMTAAETAKSEAASKDKEKEATEWAALLEKMPELKDGKRLQALATDIAKFGNEYGFSADELRGLRHDHRLAVVMSKAIEWDKLKASKPKVQKQVENRPPVTRGGKRLSPAESKARGAADALNRLKQSGRVDDAVAALLATQRTG